MSATEFRAAGAAAMELGEVMGLQQGTAPSPGEGDLGLLKPAGLTQAAASHPSPFLDEQKMLRFSKAAQALPSGLDLGRPNEQAFLLSRTKRPFTPSQWMELEHQALIYKYLHAKAPIPSSLLISISKSFRSSNRVSWRPLYQGYTNADSDPEPGRCRRTDGKKWRCSKEAMADHKYCERHINRNRHRSRKPVENQPKKTAKETPAAAGSLPCAVSQGSLKKAKVNDSKPGTVSYWTDSLNRTMLSKEKANQPTENGNVPLLNSTNQQPTLSLLSQLKQHNKPDKFSPAVDSESISDTILKAWESRNQQSHKSISSTQLHDAESLQSVLQNFRLAKNENTDSEKNKYSDSMLVSSTFYHSTEGPRTTCLTSNMTQVQADGISSSWEMPQGGPLGEILTNSKNSDDSNKKCESRSYGWLLNLDHSP
ncbi:growth-regulating factor 9-like [Panicum miliaceum]|uniref:Growth-regulating factor n=1 Tax=Panicum miliaceum TaxID=4540 RepID=A0A3L6TQW1_PANMI|nr:growth-regulating factor 9-like [Panicum miliaceum]